VGAWLTGAHERQAGLGLYRGTLRIDVSYPTFDGNPYQGVRSGHFIALRALRQQPGILCIGVQPLWLKLVIFFRPRRAPINRLKRLHRAKTVFPRRRNSTTGEDRPANPWSQFAHAFNLNQLCLPDPLFCGRFRRIPANLHHAMACVGFNEDFYNVHGHPKKRQQKERTLISRRILRELRGNAAAATRQPACSTSTLERFPRSRPAIDLVKAFLLT